MTFKVNREVNQKLWKLHQEKSESNEHMFIKNKCKTLVKLIINIEEGWGEHFIYDVMPIKQKRPDLFPMVLAAFANHPCWFVDHLSEIETILDRYELNFRQKS